MDVAVLNDARYDLASRLAHFGISGVTENPTDSGSAWLSELENLFPPDVIHASLEYYFLIHPQCDAGIEAAIEFYIESLKEYRLFL